MSLCVYVNVDIIKTEASAQVRYAKGTENLYDDDDDENAQHNIKTCQRIHTMMICVQQECTRIRAHKHTHTHW